LPAVSTILPGAVERWTSFLADWLMNDRLR
jgi:hypothetical protein